MNDKKCTVTYTINGCPDSFNRYFRELEKKFESRLNTFLHSKTNKLYFPICFRMFSADLSFIRLKIKISNGSSAEKCSGVIRFNSKDILLSKDTDGDFHIFTFKPLESIHTTCAAYTSIDMIISFVDDVYIEELVFEYTSEWVGDSCDHLQLERMFKDDKYVGGQMYVSRKFTDDLYSFTGAGFVEFISKEKLAKRRANEKNDIIRQWKYNKKRRVVINF